jgi:hypothetical protein
LGHYWVTADRALRLRKTLIMAEDEIADLADRMLAKHRRGEDSEFEFAIEWATLTEDEREKFMALMNERIAHRKEVLEAVTENVRILKLLFAYEQGAMPALEFVERVRSAVPDLLGQPD